MFVLKLSRTLLATALVLPAAAQSLNLPAAPLPAAPPPLFAPSAKPNFALPPQTADTSKSVSADQLCYAPAEGIYGPRKADTPQQDQALRRYTDLVMQQVDSFWYRHQPRAVNDPWVKGKEVVVRFAIFPNGTYDTPIITVFSGRTDFDRHALDSVGSFASFPPLPEGVTRPQRFCMHFRYNLDNTSPTKPIDLWPTKPAAKP